MTNLEDEEEVGKKVEIEITNPVENAETNQRIFYNDLIIYGNHLQNKKPYKMGNLYTFFYYNEMPLIVIGTTMQATNNCGKNACGYSPNIIIPDNVG